MTLKFFLIIPIIICLIFGIDIFLIMKEIYSGTKYKAVCTDFLDMVDEEGNEREHFGCVFKYIENGEEKTAYTHDISWAYANKVYKILVSDENPTHCSKMKEINKSYLFDLLILAASYAVIVFNIR